MALENEFIELKRALFDKLFSFLNDEQRKAVYSVKGPLLILAGAGSGKTTVLVNRIAYIIKYGDAYASNSVPSGINENDIAMMRNALDKSNEEIEDILVRYAVDPCPPWAALCITFTNKAAGEIKERLKKTVGATADEIWAGTFHSICMRILRRYTFEAGLRDGFTIYDTDDAKKLISNCIEELHFEEKLYPAKAVMEIISRAKDKMMSPKELAEETTSDARMLGIARIYDLYQRHLESSNAVDFDDIILRTVRLLENCREARDYYQKRFRYVSVDEYQDTNGAQFRLTELLSGRYMNLMVVGDDDQSIYRFRGATIENILNFEKVVENAKVIKLEQNYRSTSNILNAANGVIANNSGRHEKRLWTCKDDGEKITVTKLGNQNDESRSIVNRIVKLVGSKQYKFHDIAVLYRVNAQSNNIEQALAKSGIAYRMLGGLRFYERKEIKDMIAYLCVVQNTSDSIRLKRIVNEPKRKIGDTSVELAQSIADAHRMSIYDTMRNAASIPELSKYADKFNTFINIIENLKRVHENGSISELLEMTYIISGYKEMLESSGFEGRERMENIKELISNAISYEKEHENATLEGFLEDIALVSDIDNYDENADAVTLMTIHSAKGLEFPVVFLPGMEEGLFPIMQATFDNEELEEERRMAYVAITRAKELLFCSCVKERLLYGRTQYNHISRFIEEIPKQYIKSEDTMSENRERNAVTARPRVNIQNNNLSEEFTHKASIIGTQNASGGNLKILNAGDEVLHPTFGKGRILSVKPMGTDALYEVAFDEVGTKKLMATYSKLKPI